MIIPSSRELFDGTDSPRELAMRKTTHLDVKSSAEVLGDHEAYSEALRKEIVAGYIGETSYDPSPEVMANVNGHLVPTLAKRPVRNEAAIRKGLDDVNLAKSAQGAPAAWEQMSKEWTLGNPVPTGLVPFDLEAPAKLLTPRPTPLRNSVARVKAQGAARRVKVISSFTGTGTGSPTIQPGVTESSTVQVGPGGLAFARGPQIGYSGYDYIVNYVTTSLSDQVSWQSEYQGQGYEDVRSLSATALLYSTMLIDERLMIYGRGTTGNGYTGALGTPSNVTCTAVSASIAPRGPSSNTTTLAASVFVVVAADAGDLLGTNGYSMHQGPATVATSCAVTTGQAVQVTVGTDVTGALGYNLYCASTAAGPYVYAGRTGYNVGYITAQPVSGPTVLSGGVDQSAVATNYDGLLTNVSASGGYVARLNAPFSVTSPGAEFQTAFANLYEAVKADPQELWLNGFDRLQLSNSILNNGSSSGHTVFIDNSNVGNITAGTVVSTLVNEVTGNSIPITVHPWFPQGNALIRQKTLPIPDTNVSETSYMAMVQDYVMINWPVTQFTYDSSTFEIGTMAHVAPQWNGIISGIQGVGIGTTPPGPYGDA